MLVGDQRAETAVIRPATSPMTARHRVLAGHQPLERVRQPGRPDPEQVLEQDDAAQVVAEQDQRAGQEERIGRCPPQPQLELAAMDEIVGRQEVRLAVLGDERRDPQREPELERQRNQQDDRQADGVGVAPRRLAARRSPLAPATGRGRDRESPLAAHGASSHRPGRRQSATIQATAMVTAPAANSAISGSSG